MIKNRDIVTNLFWKFAERIGAQLVSLTVSILLARFLLPEEYGVVAILLVFINIANVFVSEGFSTALVQKKEATEIDASTMFYCSFLISWILYAILFVLSPSIEIFYKMDGLANLLRVLALKLPIAAINSIQHAYVQRSMQFKKFFFSTIIGTLISGVVGVALAFLGFGPWALVAQYLTNSTIDTVVLFYTVKWRPRMVFSAISAKEMMRYGWKITCGSLLNTIYSETRSLIIGKKYSSSDLAYYNKGVQFPQLIVTNIDSSIGSVLFPALSKITDEKQRLKETVRKSLKMSCYIIFPCMAGLAAVSTPLIKLLLTDKWLPAVFFLHIACITQALQPINTANIQLIKALGRSDYFLKMEAIKKFTGIVTLLITMWFGVKFLAAGEIVVVLVCNLINAYPNKKLIDYGYMEQLHDILPSALMTGCMYIIVRLVSAHLHVTDIALIAIDAMVGVMVYVGISVLVKSEELEALKRLILKK